MNKCRLLNLTFALTILSSHVWAEPNQKQAFHHPLQASVVVTQPSMNAHGSNVLLQGQLPKNTVFLMNISLTQDQRRQLQTFSSESHQSNLSSYTSPKSIPSQVELGMNDVPVLDQGQHGTCVTFASTGALDALIAKGDYVSQLCSLELGNYLEKVSYYPSGWDGSFGPMVLNRLLEFGIVSRATQTSKSCAGIKEYPLKETDNIGKPLTLDENVQISEDASLDFYWYPLVSSDERFSWDAKNPEQANNLVDRVKEVLATKDAKANLRVTFGSLLPVDYCSAGACAKHHKTDDTWALTKAIKNDPHPTFGGHEMIITGYDDNAIATDNEGAKHKGLFTLRNSWSSAVGDNGNYYMTYEFFKQYVMEAQVVGKNL